MAERTSGSAEKSDATPADDEVVAPRGAEDAPAPSDVDRPVAIDPGVGVDAPGRVEAPVADGSEPFDRLGDLGSNEGPAGTGLDPDYPAGGDLAGVAPDVSLDKDPYDGIDPGLQPGDSPLGTSVERELGGLDGTFDPTSDFLSDVGPDPNLADLDPSAAGEETVKGAGYEGPGSYSESDGISGVAIPEKSADGEATGAEELQAKTTSYSGSHGAAQMKAALDADDESAGVDGAATPSDGGAPTETGTGYFTDVAKLDAEQQAALADTVAEVKAATPEGRLGLVVEGDIRFLVYGNKKQSAPNEDVVDGEGEVDFDPTAYEDDPSQYMAIKLASIQGDDVYTDGTDAAGSAAVEVPDFGDDVGDKVNDGQLPTYEGPDTIGDQVPDGDVIDPME